MSQNIDIKEFTKLENLEQFRFNLENEAHSFIERRPQKQKISDQSLSEFVAEDSIKQLSAQMGETNAQVKKLQESVNALLTQQIQLQKQLIDQVARNSCILERVVSMNSTVPHPETPASQPVVSSNNGDDALHEIVGSKDKSRLTFTQRQSGIIKEEIKKESDLFEDFIM